MADMSDPLVVSDAPLLDPADTHLAHTASVVVIGSALAVLALTAALSAYRLVFGLLRRRGGRYTPAEHRILWAVLIAASGYVAHKLWTRLHLAYRVRDLFLAPAFAAGFLYCARWWQDQERLRYGEYDAQDAAARQRVAKGGGKKAE